MSDPRPNAFATLRCVALNPGFVDGALDLGRSFPDLYRVTRDRKHLAVREGQQPFEFLIQRLPKRLSAVIDKAPAPEAYWLAFRLGCHRIERGGEVILEVRAEDCTKGQFGTLIAPDEWVDQVADYCTSEGTGFGLATVEEMGRVVYSSMKLAPGAAGPFDFRVS